ncbi:MAG: thioredoxin family protein [Alphaproteobacteria bacterium]|nr:thioredoxin family protein [Alphaproteobacteria bacterium]
MLRTLLVLLILLFPLPSYAMSSAWAGDADASARLISGVDGTGTGTALPLGLEVKLGPEWHTYWRSPGEAGLPPRLDWSASETDAGNLQSATMFYPAPARYTAYGMETIGYRNDVVFPIDGVLRKPGQAAHIAVGADLLICSSICVPKHFDLTLDIPAGPATPSAEAPLLQQARAEVPDGAARSGLLIRNIVNDGQSLSFSITSRNPLTHPDIFIEDPDNIDFSAPAVKTGPNGMSATLTVKPIDTLPPGVTLAGMKLTLTLVNDSHASEIKTVAPPVSAASPAPAPKTMPFWLALLSALIGGLILNLMPCVLPVLSLKVLSVANHGGGTPKLVRHSFLVTAAGIVFSFLVLATGTAGLRHFGIAMGWGVQFQQPLFLMFLILLLTFFAANLWNLFEIPLPQWLVDRIDTSYHPKLAGDFVTGAFATLLATPCSAPFLGTAVGFALATGTPHIFAIFSALGCGMALPYLLVALFPRTATALPKPGPWMVKLRVLLGFALALTALWLTWVLAAQISPAYAAVFGLLMAGVVILFALKKRGLKRGLIALGIAEFCFVGLVLGFNGMTEHKPPPQTDRKWLAFNQMALKADIAEGKTVFLDVTADWCLTCKANMKFTLSRGEVAQRLFHSGIVAMQADWTNPDPVISDLLRHYGRYGIPFNAVFGPHAPQGIVLPELLTPQLVLDALDKASGTKPKDDHAGN